MQIKKKKPDTNLLTSDLVFIGGLTRSGKSFLCPIISSLNNSETFICDSIAENIYYANFLKKIDDDYAKFFLKLIYNEKIYNLRIGRNLNRRDADYSSITHSVIQKIYDKREKSTKEGDDIINKIKKDKNFFPIMFHDVLLKPKLIFESFQNSKIIFIERHPVELIYEWENKKYYGDFYSNPRNMTLSHKYNDKLYPYWCFDSEQEFSNLKNSFEKTIFLIEKLYTKQKKNFLSLNKKNKKNIMIIKYDAMVGTTNYKLKAILSFLKTTKGKKTNYIIKKQNGNRDLNNEFKKKQREKILSCISLEYKKKLYKLEKIYEK